jgi:hypothetical protein
LDAIKKTTNAELWTQCQRAQTKFNLNRIEGVSKPGLGRSIIHFGGNSGYQAMNLAFIFGITKMILLGFDMQRTHDKVHFFGRHPYHRLDRDGPSEHTMTRWVQNFEIFARDLVSEGVEVINASRETALRCFPRQALEDIC